MAQKKVAGKKTSGVNKRGPKAKQVEEEKPAMEVEASDDDSEDSEENNDSNDSEVNGAADLVDSEAEDDDGDDDDDDDDDDDEDDDNDDDEEDDDIEPGQISLTKGTSKNTEDQADEDSDAAPVEAPISKKKLNKTDKETGIPKVPIGRIPKDVPRENQVFLSQLPVVFKHQDLIAVFSKFGRISVVNRIKTSAGAHNMVIAFESKESAEAALAAKPKAVTLNNQVISVSSLQRKEDLNERTIVVGLIGTGVTREQITEHFKSCGEVESVNFSKNRILPSAFVRFQSVDSIPKALKLNGSELNSRFITVRTEAYKRQSLKSPELTLTVANTGNHVSYKNEDLEKIFKKHGEVTDLDIVCTRGILAFVTYQTPEQTEKALKALDGKTVGELEIKLGPYHHSSSVRTILVTNLANGVEEEELNELFSNSGEIESIKMLSNKAVIRFTTDDGFCKSFLTNEHFLGGQPIFIEPNSNIKHKILQKKLYSNKQNLNREGQQPFNKNRKFSKPFNNNKSFNKRGAEDNGPARHTFKKFKNGN